MTKRICVWSGPRNISTALMYSFAQREDTTVVDEPLYAHYLTSTDAFKYHPGAEAVINSQENDGEKVVSEVIFGEYQTPVVFFKHMTHHLVDLDWSFLDKTINVILTREPREMLTSFIKQIPSARIEDTGYPQHLKLLQYLNELGQTPLIVNSKDVLLNPELKLREMCQNLEIPFDHSMLKWDAGKRKEDGVWAEHWYHNVHKSTGFQKYQPKPETLPERYKPLLATAQKLYNELISTT